MPLFRAALLVALIAGMAACGDRNVQLDLELVTTSCDRGSSADPLLGVQDIRVRAYHLPEFGGEPDFVADSEFETQAVLDAGTLSLPNLPAGSDRYLLVEGLAANGHPVSRALAGPLEIDEPGEFKTALFLRRLNRFSPVNSAAKPGECSQMFTSRWGHSATELSDGRVLIAGGYNAEYEVLSSTEIYDPKTGIFERGPNMHQARAFHTATRIPGTKLTVLAGGEQEFTERKDAERLALNTAEIYDEEKGVFSSVTLREPRVRHVATVASGGGKLILIGGIKYESSGGAGPTEVVLSSTEVFDPKEGRFEAGVNLPRPRADHSVIASRGGAVIAGGHDGAGLVRDVEFLRYHEGNWVSADSVGELSLGRVHPFMGVVGEFVVVGGGQTSAAPKGNVWHDMSTARPVTQSLEYFTVGDEDDKQGEIELHEARGNADLVTLKDGNSLIFGGIQPASNGVATVSRGEVLRLDDDFIPSTTETLSGMVGTLNPDGPSRQSGRYFHAQALLSDGTVFITGGIDRNNAGTPEFLRSAEIYQPSYRSTQNSPFK